MRPIVATRDYDVLVRSSLVEETRGSGIPVIHYIIFAPLFPVAMLGEPGCVWDPSAPQSPHRRGQTRKHPGTHTVSVAVTTASFTGINNTPRNRRAWSMTQTTKKGQHTLTYNISSGREYHAQSDPLLPVGA